MRSLTRSSNSPILTFAQARSGQTYASIGGLHLNSPYDPKHEAERFAAEKTGERPPAAVLILGDTLPYLREAIRERHPAVEIISIYYHDGFHTTDGARAKGSSLPRHCWSPGHPNSLQSYLRTVLSQLDVTGLVVLEWPPSAAAFPHLAAEASTAAAQIVRETVAEVTTEAAFSRTWLHNLFTNFLLLDSWFSLRSHHHPVAIAASGPSLSRAMPLLSSVRSKLHLIALPSSLEAIDNAGMSPDLVVSVDGGYWAQHHLRTLDDGSMTPVAMPLIAARGIWRRTTSPVLLSAGSFIENALFERSAIAPSGILATGTVAATAYELSALLTDGPIIFAGLDLCNEGLREHVRPHTFDTYLELLATRTTPLPTILADRLFKGDTRSRATGWSASRALETYADWFRSTGTGRSTYRLLPSEVRLDGFRELDADGLVALLKDAPSAVPLHLETKTHPPAIERRRIVSTLIASWEEQLQQVGRALAATRRPAPLASTTDAETHDAELLRSLDPAGYLRYRRALHRELDSSSAERANELLANVEDAVATLRRRYLS